VEQSNPGCKYKARLILINGAFHQVSIPTTASKVPGFIASGLHITGSENCSGKHNPLVPGSSPGGPTNNLNTNSRVGIFLSVTLSNAC